MVSVKVGKRGPELCGTVHWPFRSCYPKDHLHGTTSETFCLQSNLRVKILGGAYPWVQNLVTWQESFIEMGFLAACGLQRSRGDGLYLQEPQRL